MSQALPIDSIRPNPVALRQVEVETEDFEGLRDSIKQYGVMNAISVRPKTDPETGTQYYELIDGLHRYTAAKAAGLTEINATIEDVPDSQILARQIVANTHKIDTKPVQYTEQLNRMMLADPSITVGDVARMVNRSIQWVNERFQLLKLNENVKKLVDDGKITVINAKALSKLPPVEQDEFTESAMVQEAKEFTPTVEARVKQLRDAARSGRDAGASGFVPTVACRKMADIKAEIATPTAASAVIAENNVTDPVAAFTLALKWVTNQDPGSIAAQEAKYNEKKAQLEEARNKAKQDRANAKLNKAAQEALAAKVEGGNATDDEKAQHEANVKAAAEAAAAAQAPAAAFPA